MTFRGMRPGPQLLCVCSILLTVSFLSTWAGYRGVALCILLGLVFLGQHLVYEQRFLRLVVGDVYVLGPNEAYRGEAYDVTVVDVTASPEGSRRSRGDYAKLNADVGRSSLRVAGVSSIGDRRVLVDVRSPSLPGVTRILVDQLTMGRMIGRSRTGTSEAGSRTFARELASINAA